jgi:hypothetical protein
MTTIRERCRLAVAHVWDWLFPRSCWAESVGWAMGYEGCRLRCEAECQDGGSCCYEDGPTKVGCWCGKFKGKSEQAWCPAPLAMSCRASSLTSPHGDSCAWRNNFWLAPRSHPSRSCNGLSNATLRSARSTRAAYQDCCFGGSSLEIRSGSAMSRQSRSVRSHMPGASFTGSSNCKCGRLPRHQRHEVASPNQRSLSNASLEPRRWPAIDGGVSPGSNWEDTAA